jgi:hypothetical protein
MGAAQVAPADAAGGHAGVGGFGRLRHSGIVLAVSALGNGKPEAGSRQSEPPVAVGPTVCWHLYRLQAIFL